MTREPAPLSSYKRIQPGDVGYIRAGCFHLLFSAGCPLGERQPGVDVPLTFKPLDVGPIANRQPRLPGSLSTTNVRAGRIRLRHRASPPLSSPPAISSFPYVRSDAFVPSSTSDISSRMLEPGSTISFRLTGGQGAALLTKYKTLREDVERAGTFEGYAKKHFASWVAFARETGHGDDINPVLVTGVDRTKDFAMMSYSGDDHNMTSEFTTSVPEVASTSVWGTWHTAGFVFTNCGSQLGCPPSPTQTVDSTSSGDDNTEPGSDWFDQCVFVRYYTVRKRLGIPRIIKAGAGPHDPGTGSCEDGESPKAEARSPSDQDQGPSTLDLSDYPRTSHSTTRTTYVAEGANGSGDELSLIEDDEPENRMSLLGIKMRFHSKAPWEADGEDALEEEGPALGSGDRPPSRSKRSVKSFTTRPSVESSRSNKKSLEAPQYSIGGALQCAFVPRNVFAE